MKKETRNLILFFVATFTWTWAFYAPIAVGHHNAYEMPWTILLILGGMGPSVIGVALVLLTFDTAQKRDFWGRSISVRRIRLPWWALIVFLFPLVYGVSIACDLAFGGAGPGMTQLRDLVAAPATIPLVAFISFLSGPWSEEFGWRGYALDRMMARLGTVPGTVVLGTAWGIWHLPLYFMAGTWHSQMGFALSGFWTFVVGSVGLSLIMTSVYLNTSRSILAAMLMHYTSNFTAQLLAPVSNQVEVTRTLLMVAIGCAVMAIVMGKSKVGRERSAKRPLHGSA